jgi:uncharacterized membrane protein (UPF0127 family)
MKKLFIFAILLLTSFFIFLNFQYKDAKTPKAVVNNYSFHLEIAKTQKEKEIGLSKYNNIANDFGMLFPFEKADYYAFWMKDMKFPIDIIFIRNNKIVTIFKNVPAPKSNNQSPPIYKPSELSDTVLEINAGLSEKYNFQKNQVVKINY